MFIMVFSNEILFSLVMTAIFNCGYSAHNQSPSSDLSDLDDSMLFGDKSSSSDAGDDAERGSIEFWRVSSDSHFFKHYVFSIFSAPKDDSYYRVSRVQIEEFFRSEIGKYYFDLTGPNHKSLCITLIKDCPDLRGHILDEEMKDESIDAFKGCSHLMYACMIGDDKGVELLIQRGAKVNKASDYGATPLLAACQRNNTKIVDLLLNAGASPDCAIFSPIMVACGNNTFGKPNLEMAISLFRHGADLFKGGHARSAFSYLTNENRAIFLSLLTHKEIERFMPDYQDFQAAEIALEEAMEKLYA